MAHDGRDTAICASGPDVVLGRDGVLLARERELQGDVGVAGDHVVFSRLGRSGDQGEELLGVGGRGQDVGGARIDGGGFAGEVARLAVDVDVVHGDGPGVSVDTRVRDVAVELGCIDVSKRDGSVMVAVTGARETKSHQVGLEKLLFGDRVHERGNCPAGRVRSAQAEDSVDRVAAECLGSGRRRPEGQ